MLSLSSSLNHAELLPRRILEQRVCSKRENPPAAPAETTGGYGRAAARGKQQPAWLQLLMC